MVMDFCDHRPKEVAQKKSAKEKRISMAGDSPRSAKTEKKTDMVISYYT